LQGGATCPYKLGQTGSCSRASEPCSRAGNTPHNFQAVRARVQALSGDARAEMNENAAV